MVKEVMSYYITINKVPIYLRWTAGSKEVLPMYFSNETEDNFYDSHITDPEKKKSIELHGMMCFEKQIGRKNLKYGSKLL